MSKQQDLDCAVLTHDNKNYIIPTLALSHIVRMNDMLMSSLDSHNNESLQILTWKSTPIPLVTPDLMPFRVAHEYHEKIAIVNALYSEQSSHPPYFALYFTGATYRIKISEHAIQWTDKETKQADVEANGMLIKVILLDLFLFSKKIEKQLSEVSQKPL